MIHIRKSYFQSDCQKIQQNGQSGFCKSKSKTEIASLLSPARRLALKQRDPAAIFKSNQLRDDVDEDNVDSDGDYFETRSAANIKFEKKKESSEKMASMV